MARNAARAFVQVGVQEHLQGFGFGERYSFPLFVEKGGSEGFHAVDAQFRGFGPAGFVVHDAQGALVGVDPVGLAFQTYRSAFHTAFQRAFQRCFQFLQDDARSALQFVPLGGEQIVDHAPDGLVYQKVAPVCVIPSPHFPFKGLCNGLVGLSVQLFQQGFGQRDACVRLVEPLQYFVDDAAHGVGGGGFFYRFGFAYPEDFPVVEFHRVAQVHVERGGGKTLGEDFPDAGQGERRFPPP